MQKSKEKTETKEAKAKEANRLQEYKKKGREEKTKAKEDYRRARPKRVSQSQGGHSPCRCLRTGRKD